MATATKDNAWSVPLSFILRKNSPHTKKFNEMWVYLI